MVLKIIAFQGQNGTFCKTSGISGLHGWLTKQGRKPLFLPSRLSGEISGSLAAKTHFYTRTRENVA